MYKQALLVLSAALVLLGGPACAATRDLSSTVEIAIPAQPLASALLEFSAQTGMQVVTAGADVRDLRTAGFSGRVTVGEALKKLLVGSGLSFKLMGENTVGLTRTVEASREIPLHLAQAPTDERSAVALQRADEEISEIIVTAQKRAERMIEVPQSVSVLSAQDLNKLGATQFRDFANTVPGLTFNTSGAGETQVSLRGVTAGFDISPTVGIYVDDVPFGSSASFVKAAAHALDVALFDIERVEVLRGPQGTLYGASAMGGLIKYVSKQPDMERSTTDLRFGTSATEDGGVNYDVSAAVSAPLVADKAAVRASGFYSHDDGYVDNLELGQRNVNQADIRGGRLDLFAKPSDALSLHFSGYVQDISRDGAATADYTLAGGPVDGTLDQRHPLEEPFDQQFRLVSGTVNYDFGAARLTSISSYQTAEGEYLYDVTHKFAGVLSTFFGLDYSAIGFLNDQRVRKFTQEVRLASNRESNVEWLVGAYYTDETGRNDQRFVLSDLAGQPALNGVYSYSLPSEYEEIAGFANLTYQFSERFDLSGGLRYAQNDQTTTQIGSGLFIGSTPTRSASEDVTTYLANMRYHINDHSTAYLRYATGYRPGGPNSVANDPVTGVPVGQPTFEADTLKSYEVGFKAESMDRRFGMEAALYHIDWNNIQIITTSSSGISVTGNASEATIDGAELTLRARPIRALSLSGALAYQDATLAEGSPDLGAAKGDRLPNVPRVTAALNADYEFLNFRLEPTVGATLRHMSDRVASFDLNPTQVQYNLPKYTIVDLRAGLRVGRVDLQLNLRNAFDERAQLIAPTGLSLLNGPAQVSILQPRTLGLSAAFSF